jgi:glycosyltransferase involved in cell wall biosynthesis
VVGEENMRAAILPSPGDCFVLLHFLHYFKTVWQDEVDKLYIGINSDVETTVIYELLDELKHPKIVISYYDRPLGHGKAINLLLEQCDEDFVVLLEDDSIIFKKGFLTEKFDQLEGNEAMIIGSPRMSCPKQVADMAAKEFNLNYEGWGDKGPAFWPCFFFTRTNFLKSTSRHFGSSEMGDTFVRSSIEMRRKIHKSMSLTDKKGVFEIPQYHCSPDDYQNKEANRGIFDGNCGYMHFGSLSSGIENTLLDQRGVPLKERTKDVGLVKIRQPQSEQERMELEKRVMWWNESYRLNQGKFGEFGEAYGYAIENVIKECKLSWEAINNWRKLYYEVISNH